MGTLRYIVRRLLFSLVLIVGVSLIIFILINAIGNPIDIIMAERPGITQDVMDAMTAHYGLDEPMHLRYLAWLWSLLQLDFGISLVYNQPVGQMLWYWGLETLKIQAPAILLAVAIATLMGTIAATRQYSRTDFAVMTTALLGQSLPGFFVGILLILIFSYWLGIFPSYGAYSMRSPVLGSEVLDVLWHMVLPVMMLTFFNTATLTLLMRANMSDVLRHDFITAARASGLPERKVVYGHAMKNAFIPVLTYLGILFGLMLGSAPVTEAVFTWPGLGSLYITAIQQLDYPVIMGATMVITVTLILGTLLTDIAYVLIDPRIRLD
ncbi:ABC transporter permease [Marinivivus vitaminiproducens]|uniref:ABC transporter permease n=1 Tax=Marinivivus vitaminiproducens TaxID=3035935 RepID=UPI0027A6718C|nr:ABC transporter permease [Geminicoccaceae bacterium SCSIO 64248]